MRMLVFLSVGPKKVGSLKEGETDKNSVRFLILLLIKMYRD